MKPTRVRMTHSLVMNYGLYKKMEIYVCRSMRLPVHNTLFDPPRLQRAKPATKREMTQFHSDDYIEFLYKVTPNNMNNYQKEQAKCAVPFWKFSLETTSKRIDGV
jgi:histone deacetylase 1/2